MGYVQNHAGGVADSPDSELHILKNYKQMNIISAISTGIIALCSVIGLQSYTLSAASGNQNSKENESDFEKAVQIIKKYETMHKPKHWPFVGYGHKVLKGEKFNRKKTLSESEADALLRKDLLKNCAYFRQFGKDSLLLGVLSYNIGNGATMRSSLIKKLKAGNRNIRDIYLSFCRYRGKVHSGIKARRLEEFETLYIKENSSGKKASSLMIREMQTIDVIYDMDNLAHIRSLIPMPGNNQNSQNPIQFYNTRMSCISRPLQYYFS